MSPTEPAPDPAREIVVIVDDDNRVVGTTTRARMRARGLAHRATYIFVFDRDGRLLVQRRTTTKDVYPGYFDLCAGGVVLAGETYDESAVREAEEELGITGTALIREFDFFYRQDGHRCWGQVYRCIHDGPFILQPEEVEHVEFATVEDILAGAFDPVTPDSRQALDELRRRGRR